MSERTATERAASSEARSNPESSEAGATARLGVEERLFALLTEVTAVQPADIELTDRLREDLNMDSVASMELLSMISEEFDVEVELEESLHISTVQQVVTLVRERYRG